jgi:hypothetical protein
VTEDLGAVQVQVLDPGVAAQFLTARTGDTDQVAALELAAKLGGLPLALEQAAAYMQATGTPPARYLPLFQPGRPTCWHGVRRRGTGSTRR